ncbi:MAG: Yip1 family protein [Paludibacter sp.]
MEESFEEVKEEIYFTDKEIFFRIWTSPRLVLKYINDKEYGEYVNILLVLAGILNVFDRAITKNFGDNMPLWGVIFICIAAGALLGWLSFYIYAALVSWTGGLLHGEGDTESILRIMSYAKIPVIFVLVLLAVKIVAYGNALFQSDVTLEYSDWADNLFLFGFGALSLILNVWTIVLTVIGVSEVQKLSIWKSVLNLILPILIIGGPILIIIYLFQAF